MALSAAAKAEIIKDYQVEEGDTGSPEVQVADPQHQHPAGPLPVAQAGSRDVIRMVNQRRKLLDYLKRKNASRYAELISRLGLRR